MKFQLLYESHQYTSEQNIQSVPLRELLDFFYLQLLTLYILSDDVDFKQYAKEYARRSYSNNYKKFRASKTDLYNIIVAITHGMHKPDDDLLNDITINTKSINRLLKMIINDKIVDQQFKLLLKDLEKDLAVRSSDYRAIRTIVINWEQSNTNRRKVALTRLKMALRAYGNRNELTFYLNDYIDALNYTLNKPAKRNPEKELHLGKWAAIGAGASVLGIMAGHKQGKELRKRYKSLSRSRYESYELCESEYNPRDVANSVAAFLSDTWELNVSVKHSTNRYHQRSSYITTPFGVIRISDHSTSKSTAVMDFIEKSTQQIISELKPILINISKKWHDRNSMINTLKTKLGDNWLKEYRSLKRPKTEDARIHKIQRFKDKYNLSDAEFELLPPSGIFKKSPHIKKV